MKKLVAILPVFLLFPCCLNAQNIDTRRHIEVQATSKVLADVDRVEWQIKLRGEEASLGDASKSLDDALASLRQRLKAAGLSVESLRLSGIASGKSYENTGGGAKVFKGYFAEREAIVGLPDLSARQTLESVLLGDHRVEIVRISLRSSKHEELRRQALTGAISAAKEKAVLLAVEAGEQVGPVLSIREGNTNPEWITVTENRVTEPVFARDDKAEFEKVEYSSTVTVKFELK